MKPWLNITQYINKMNKKDKPLPVSFYESGNSIYELVGDGKNNFFAKYDLLAESVEICEEIHEGNQVIVPLADDLSKNGVILLPTEAVEFGCLEELEGEIQTFIHKYVQLTPFGEMIATKYVLLSWVYDRFETIPYLRFLGDYGSGKSRAERVIGSVCYKPIFAGGSTTPSPIFRIIQLYRGTLIIDEADFRQSDMAAEITKILNCGYSKGTPVLRSEGDKNGKFEPRAYNVYSPKILATRKTFADVALESRCITERVRPKDRSDIPLHLPEEFYEQALKLRNKLLMFRFKYYLGVRYKPELEIAGVEPRINQVMVPLLSLVDDEDRRQELVEFVKEYNRRIVDQRADSVTAEVLQAIVALKKHGHIPYKDIQAHVNANRNPANGEKLITTALIGRINKNAFGFDRRKPSNFAHIVWDQKFGEELCRRYGIELPVDDNNVSDVSDVSPEEAQQIFLEPELNNDPNTQKKANKPNIVNG